jgi:hypothetical protein
MTFPPSEAVLQCGHNIAIEWHRIERAEDVSEDRRTICGGQDPEHSCWMACSACTIVVEYDD